MMWPGREGLHVAYRPQGRPHPARARSGTDRSFCRL